MFDLAVSENEGVLKAESKMKKFLLILNIVLFAAVAACDRPRVDIEDYRLRSYIDNGNIYRPIDSLRIKKNSASFTKMPWVIFYNRDIGISKTDFRFVGPVMLHGDQYITNGFLNVTEFAFGTCHSQDVEGEYSITIEPSDNTEILFWHGWHKNDVNKNIEAGYRLRILDGELSLFRIQSQEFIPVNFNKIGGGKAEISFYSIRNRRPSGTYTYVLSVNGKIAASFRDVPSIGDMLISHGVFSEIKFRGEEGFHDPGREWVLLSRQNQDR